MYSDLDKKAKGGYILEDASDVNEVFDTAFHIRRGQIFYGRQYGEDFEEFLLRLNEPTTIIAMQDSLHRLRNMDGRLLVDPSQTKVIESEGELIAIQTALNIQGLPQVSVTGLIEESENTTEVLNDNVDISTKTWNKVYTSDEYSLTLTDGTILNFKNGKLNSIEHPETT